MYHGESEEKIRQFEIEGMFLNLCGGMLFGRILFSSDLIYSHLGFSRIFLFFYFLRKGTLRKNLEEGFLSFVQEAQTP